jgi:hypothetical protein
MQDIEKKSLIIEEIKEPMVVITQNENFAQRTEIDMI